MLIFVNEKSVAFMIDFVFLPSARKYTSQLLMLLSDSFVRFFFFFVKFEWKTMFVSFSHTFFFLCQLFSDDSVKHKKSKNVERLVEWFTYCATHTASKTSVNHDDSENLSEITIRHFFFHQ